AYAHSGPPREAGRRRPVRAGALPGPSHPRRALRPAGRAQPRVAGDGACLAQVPGRGARLSGGGPHGGDALQRCRKTGSSSGGRGTSDRVDCRPFAIPTLEARMPSSKRLAFTAVLLMSSSSCTPSGVDPAPAPASTAASTMEAGGASAPVGPSARIPDARTDDDPFLWLEEVEGEQALAWVEEHNASTVAELSATPVYQPIFQRTLEILDSEDRIPYPSILGDRLYNFWQDAENPRGVWRRITWEAYLAGDPAWEV